MHKAWIAAPVALMLMLAGAAAPAQVAPQQPGDVLAPAAKLNLTLEQRHTIRELVKDMKVDAADPAARIAQEAALLAERSDISEELDRLRSHLQQFTKLLDGAGELGKKLDFLLQEMHREANTLLSKTPGVESEALAITGLALEIKADDRLGRRGPGGGIGARGETNRLQTSFDPRSRRF